MVGAPSVELNYQPAQSSATNVARHKGKHELMYCTGLCSGQIRVNPLSRFGVFSGRRRRTLIRIVRSGSCFSC
jgi:hypothetical protein